MRVARELRRHGEREKVQRALGERERLWQAEIRTRSHGWLMLLVSTCLVYVLAFIGWHKIVWVGVVCSHAVQPPRVA